MKKCKHENTIEIIYFWAFFCTNCNRLCVDNEWLDKENTIARLNKYLRNHRFTKEDRKKIRSSLKLAKNG